jgi:iron complex outermembrane receptor protein
VKTEGTPPLNWSSLASIVLQTKLQNKKTSRGNLMKNYVNILSKKIVLASFVGSFGLSLVAQEIEEVVVTAEKRSENLQDISQAVTALTESDIEEKNITSFVDLSAIVPGVTVAKNEGYKTIISIRGVGNETNQNAIAAPSVAYHMDGVFIASPFALGTEFLDVERIEVLRGPQGTLFGQNSTGGAVNVISKAPSMDGGSGRMNVTFGDYNLRKVSTSNNFVVNDKIATRFSLSSSTRDGFTKNVYTGQDLDDDNSKSFRTDWMFNLNDTSSLRVFGQYFKVDRNGAAIRGIDDQTSGMRKLSQDTISQHELSSWVLAAIYESDLGFANLKAIASVQEDDVLVVRDNDRHNYLDPVLSIPGLGAGATYQRAEFTPETSLVDTTTLEINLISNQPIEDRLDWTVGMFYMDHEIENVIRGYRDDDLDGRLKYLCDESFADPSYCYDHDYGIPGRFDIFGPAAEVDFFTDANPGRESFSIYGQTTLYVSDTFRIVSGLRYSEDTFTTDVTNFLNVESFQEEGTTDEVTSRVVGEFDLSEDTMLYVALARGFKPGGSNLTFGFTEEEDAIAGRPVAPAMVFPTFESETVESVELGLKSTFADGKARANLAAFSYTYENLQFQATDPDPYRGGVANIPESEMSGLEIEFTGFVTDSLSIDMNLAFLESEVTSDYEVLDNVDAYQYFFGQEDLRYGLRENVRGNQLAKTPEFTADILIKHETNLPSGNTLTTTVQYVRRGEFQQRVSNNPIVDDIRAYTIGNLTTSIDFSDSLAVDFMVLNVTDESGVNSSMTDVFGVAATGLELIPPRQVMTRLRYSF